MCDSKSFDSTRKESYIIVKVFKDGESLTTQDTMERAKFYANVFPMPINDIESGSTQRQHLKEYAVNSDQLQVKSIDHKSSWRRRKSISGLFNIATIQRVNACISIEQVIIRESRLIECFLRHCLIASESARAILSPTQKSTLKPRESDDDDDEQTLMQPFEEPVSMKAIAESDAGGFLEVSEVRTFNLTSCIQAVPNLQFTTNPLSDEHRLQSSPCDTPGGIPSRQFSPLLAPVSSVKRSRPTSSDGTRNSLLLLRWERRWLNLEKRLSRFQADTAALIAMQAVQVQMLRQEMILARPPPQALPPLPVQIAATEAHGLGSWTICIAIVLAAWTALALAVLSIAVGSRFSCHFDVNAATRL